VRDVCFLSIRQHGWVVLVGRWQAGDRGRQVQTPKLGKEVDWISLPFEVSCGDFAGVGVHQFKREQDRPEKGGAAMK
jgi:hypothetical protein